MLSDSPSSLVGGDTIWLPVLVEGVAVPGLDGIWESSIFFFDISHWNLNHFDLVLELVLYNFPANFKLEMGIRRYVVAYVAM
jgi:hypothetical protein